MSLQNESISAGHADTYREYNRLRLADVSGSGKADVTAVPDWIITNGDGVFWRVDKRNENTVFLYHPARVARMLRTAVEILPFTAENGDC
jgi:hypothetical protein